MENISHLAHNPRDLDEEGVWDDSSCALPTWQLIFVISDQLLVGLHKSLQKVQKTHHILTKRILSSLHLLVLLLNKVALDDVIDLFEHALVLLAVALVEALELSIRDEALAVRKEERFEDAVLEDVPRYQHVDQYEGRNESQVRLKVENEANCTGHCNW